MAVVQLQGLNFRPELLGGGSTPNPMLLPAATDQALDTLAYVALNVSSMVPGDSYTDPVTGVTIVKLTTSTSPISGTATQMCGVDYASGGCRIGRPTGGVYPIVVMRSPNGTGDFHVITFNPSTKTVGYRCAAPGQSAREISRAMSFVTPNVMYAFSGSPLNLRKYDVSGSSFSEITGGVWPKDWGTSHLHGQSRFVWLQSTVDDRYFAAQAGDSGPWVIVWDSQTDTFYEHQFGTDPVTGKGFNEFKMAKDLPYIHSTGQVLVWDAVNNLETSFTLANGYYSHNDTLRGYSFGHDGDVLPSGFWRSKITLVTPDFAEPDLSWYYGNLYSNGGWVDQTGDLTQWMLLGNQSRQVAVITSSSVANPSIITTAAAHGISNGQTVEIDGHSGSSPNINGDYTITLIDTTHFSIPVNVSVGGSGGTVLRRFGSEKIRSGGLGMERLNGSGGLRLLCYTYDLGDVNGTPDYYTNSLWPNMSPDGKFCLFKSNMNSYQGFASLFAAILPTS